MDNDTKMTQVAPHLQSYKLDGLATWKEYKIWVVAFTTVGDGPPSPHILVQTDEDGR